MDMLPVGNSDWNVTGLAGSSIMHYVISVCYRLSAELHLHVIENLSGELQLRYQSTVDVSAEVLVHFARDDEPSVGGNLSILEDDVGGMVAGKFGEGKIALGHENLLNSPVTPAM